MAFSMSEEVNEFIHLLHENEDEEDDILLLLAEGNSRKKHWQYRSRLDLEIMSDEECKIHFRFEKKDLQRLATALRIPEEVRCYQNTTASQLEALCVLLRRLSYPSRYSDLETLFGRSSTELCYIFSASLDHVYSTFGKNLNNLGWVTENVQQKFANVIAEKDSPLRKCWAFIDETARQICRPTQNQKHLFSGHKSYHRLKFQSVITPDGIIVHIYGPVEGECHDLEMLSSSHLYAQLGRQFGYQLPDPFYVYGDPGYDPGPFLMAPFKCTHITPEQLQFNQAMSSVRQCVEWSFGKILQYFTFVDFDKNPKLHWQSVGKIFLVATILTNCHTCLYGSQTTLYYNCDPPTLEEYLNR